MLNTLLHTRYQIVKRLGSGAFGQTYLAKDMSEVHQPACVIKRLKPESNKPIPFEIAKEMFDREIKALHCVATHPQVPQILDSFEENQEFYFVQEYIEGKTLREELNQHQAWDESQAIQFLQETLVILDFIHSQGIIHRDIKPENIICRTRDQKLCLIDFGAVQPIATMNRKPSSSIIIHSRGYTPPEQLAGTPELVSDIYALGMTCIEGLLNIQPELLTHLRDPKTQEIVWTENIRISDSLKSILSKMVCIDFRDRYSSANSVLQDLAALIAMEDRLNRDSSYIATEITLSNGDDGEQTLNAPIYISTEWEHQHLENDSDGEQLNEEVELDAEPCPITRLKRIKPEKQLTLAEVSQILQEQLNNQQKILQLMSARNAIRQLFKKRFMLVSGTLGIIGTGLAAFYISVSREAGFATYALPVKAALMQDFSQVANFTEQSKVKEHLSPIKFLTFTPDGAMLLSASQAGIIKLRNWSQQTVKTFTQTQSNILAASSSANGEILAIATEHKFIQIWSLKHQRKIKQFATDQLTWSLALDHNGRSLAMGGLGIIQQWEQIQTHPKQLKPSQLSDAMPEPVQSMAFGAAGVLVAGSANGRIRIDNAEIRKAQAFHKHSKAVKAIAFEPNGAILFTGSEDDTIRLWNLYTLKEHTLPVITTELGGVAAIAVSPTGRIMAVGGTYGTIQLWDWQTGRSIAKLSNTTTEVTALAFSPNGQMLAVGDREGKITIYVAK